MTDTVRRCLDCGGQMFEDYLDQLGERHQRSWTCWHCNRSVIEERRCYTDTDLEEALREQHTTKPGRPPGGSRTPLVL